MYEYIEDRVLEVANYIVESGATVRQAAKKFGISTRITKIFWLLSVYF